MDGGVIIKRKRAQGPFSINYGPYVVDGRISDGAARTLDLLDILCGADEEGNHSCGLIARLRHTTTRTIERHLDELKTVGLIAVEYRQGQTNVVTILDPVEVYGDEAIRNFYRLFVRRETPEKNFGGGTPDKNVGGTYDKNVGGTPDKNVGQNRGGGNRVKKTEPYGALSPEATPLLVLKTAEKKREKEAEDKAKAKGIAFEKEIHSNAASSEIASEAAGCPQDASPPKGNPAQRGGGAPPATAASRPGSRPVSHDDADPIFAPFHPEEEMVPQTLCAAPFKSERSGGQILIPGSDDEDDGRISKKPKKRGMYDPEKAPAEWNTNDAIGYFRKMYQNAWPGEGAPDVGVKDAAAVKGRLAWLKAEGIGAGMMKRAIDHLFAGWSDGLPSRMKWTGSRPGLVLIESTRWFESLVREVQGGVGASGRVDEWSGNTPEGKVREEKYAKKEEIVARLIHEGANLETAEREARRLAGC